MLGVTGRDALGVSETGHRIKGATSLGTGECGLLGSLTMRSFPGGEAKYNSEGASEVVNRKSLIFLKLTCEYMCIYVHVYEHWKNETLIQQQVQHHKGWAGCGG